jgi:hypothetical protein
LVPVATVKLCAVNVAGTAVKRKTCPSAGVKASAVKVRRKTVAGAAVHDVKEPIVVPATAASDAAVLSTVVDTRSTVA